jgi:hypothetical protein
MTWKQLIVGLLVVIVAVAILAAAFSSCGVSKSPKRQGAAFAQS